MKPAPTTPSLPARLRAARLRRGLTQAEAARAVGYRREWVTKFEGEHIESPELAAKLARLLDIRISVDDLFPEAGP